MKSIRLFKAFGPVDTKNILRDSMLLFCIVLPIIFALLFRFAVPLLTTSLMRQFQYDLVPLYPFLMAFMLLTPPILLGMVEAFLLIEHREDHTLTALRVSPITLMDYFWYRLSTMMCLSVVMTLICFPIANLVEIGFIQLLISAILAAILAPLYAIVMATFSANKVEGFALMKAGANNIFILPVFAYFFPPDWQLLFGTIPTFWTVKLFWILQAGDTGYVFYLLIGVFYQLMVLVYMAWLFNWVIRRDLSGIKTIFLELIREVIQKVMKYV